MRCDNCNKLLTSEDFKNGIMVHGTLQLGGGIMVGGKDFVIDPDFCSKKCMYEYFSNALDAINPCCEECSNDGLTDAIRGKLLCDNPKCPYVKELAKRKRSDEIIKRDGGWIPHIIKTCKKFYFNK